MPLESRPNYRWKITALRVWMQNTRERRSGGTANYAWQEVYNTAVVRASITEVRDTSMESSSTRSDLVNYGQATHLQFFLDVATCRRASCYADVAICSWK